MVRTAKLATAALCLLALIGNAADSTPTKSVSLEQINRTLSQAQTVFSRFVQERHLSLLKEPLRSEGYLCFEQPGRIRWEVTSPYKSILLSDGSGVAQFEWMDEKWRKLDMGLAGAMQNVIAQIASVIRGDYARGGRDYSVEIDQSDSGPVLRLLPRNAKMKKMIAAIEVHLAADLKATRKVVLREQNGDFTDINFTEQVVNKPFDKSVFDRNSPLGIDRVRTTLLSQRR